ncbi:hypothetical protein [Rubricoccus marinus]|uniref:Uncharacterized protein n=1 Tax=Rubricoccus marinus TaxID=716817 RepID=A0A259U115_9BACT|nr:hypothetical protein [Rubricoccus marinus]OZC03514.1 hypothetical protein BSZ36_11290 [Rubricoccus marinus]
MPDRTYSEAEVAAIFARAAEREQAAHSREPVAGLTLAEVEHAAREAGLDVASVRAAAAEVDARGVRASSRIAVAERWIEGPMAQGAWEDTVASLRREFGTSSSWWEKETSSFGEAEEWTHSAASGVRTTVTLSPREDRTLLRVQKEDAGTDNERVIAHAIAAVFSFPVAMLLGAFVAEVLGMGDAAGIAAVVLVTALGVIGGGSWLTGYVRSRRKRMIGETESLADRIAQHLTDTSPAQVDQEGQTSANSLLDASLLDAPLEAAPASGGARGPNRARS